MATLLGPMGWTMSRDGEGHREYKINWKIRGTPDEGPATILGTPGLPRPGSPWNIGTDIDLWAFCTFQMSIKPMMEEEPNTHWIVEQTFTTKPPDQQQCQDIKIESPLLEPIKISGSYTKTKEEAYADRFGRPVMTSSWEQMRGPQVEFDKSLPQVVIEQNVADLNLPLLNSMRDTVNIAPLWGVPRRCIKLSDINWERKYYGLCYKYYTRKLTFDVDYDTWDRQLLDEGTKVIHGRWGLENNQPTWVVLNINGSPPDVKNPQHFDRFKDRNGENCKVILRKGFPAGVLSGSEQAYVCVAKRTVVFTLPLTDSTFWCPIVGPYGPTDTPDWTATAKSESWTNLTLANTDADALKFASTTDSINANPVYVRGNVIQHDGAIYVAKRDIPFNRNWEPGGATGWAPRINSSSMDGWLRNWFNKYTTKPNGDSVPDSPVLNQKGYFDQNATYFSYDVVQDSADTKPGIITVQRYRESNFLLLGIPVLL